jgi:hypothetical protein
MCKPRDILQVHQTVRKADSTEFLTGWGELRELSTMPASLSTFRSHPAANHPEARRGEEKNQLYLGSELSVPYSSKPQAAWRQLWRLTGRRLGLRALSF